MAPRSPFISPETSDGEDEFQIHRRGSEEAETEESEEEHEHNLEQEILVKLQQLHKQLNKVRSESKAAEGLESDVEDRTGRKYIGDDNKLIICCVRKPVFMNKSKSGDAWEYTSSRSGFKAAVEHLATNHNVRWVAWPGAVVDPGTQDAVRRRLEHEHKCCPIFVSKDVKERYENFCWDTLWPNLHSMTTFFNQPHYNAGAKYDLEDNFVAEYDAFQYCNQLFVDKVSEIYCEGDLVLVYGYELMLLPALLRKRIPDLTCGFFLHSPFSSSEYFRMLPAREKFLHGMLGADLIAFNHFDYVRHFLNCCTSILGLSALPSKIEYHGRQVSLTICPSGIDPRKFHPVLKNPDRPRVPSTVAFVESGDAESLLAPTSTTEGTHLNARELIHQLNHRFRRNGHKLIVSLDRLDWCKGVPYKLMAFDTFLEANPEWRGKVTFFLAVRDLYGRRDRQLLKLINRMVGKVNGKWGKSDYTPVQYMMRSLSVEEIVALHCCTDVALVTSLREGINVSAMEFIACQAAFEEVLDGEPHDPAELELLKRKGVLLYSEFAGCASSFKGALVVNPYDAHQVAQSILRALTMNAKARSLRHYSHSRYVRRYTSTLWGELFLQALIEARENRNVNYLLSLDISHLRSLYERTTNRILIFDYDGSLMPYEPLSQLSDPSPSVKAALQQLCNDPCNSVIVLTGRKHEHMEEWFKDIPRLGIIADFGFWARQPNPPPHTRISRSPSTHLSPQPDRSPKQSPSLSESPIASALLSESVAYSPISSLDSISSLIPPPEPMPWAPADQHSKIDLSWCEKLQPILEAFTNRTPGSFLEAQGSSLVWHYHNADPEFGQKQANILHTYLTQIRAVMPVRISASAENKVLILQPSRVSKGRALAQILSQIQKKGPQTRKFDLVLCVTDNQLDDDMYQLWKGDEKLKHVHGLFTVTSGGIRQSRAKYYVEDSDEVLVMLQALAVKSSE